LAARRDYIQLDERRGDRAGQIDEYVKMFNACVRRRARAIALPRVLRQPSSRPRGKASYRWLFLPLLDARCQQFVFEYANPEMAEIEHWKETCVDRDVAAASSTSVVLHESRKTWPSGSRSARSSFPSSAFGRPDCGFFPVPRWVASEKLKRLVAGTRLARRQLGLA